MIANAIVSALLENDEIGDEPEFDTKRFILKRPNPSSIVIEGRNWHSRTYGQMYHTAHIYVDGKLVHVTPEQGGYGNQYAEEATEWLEENGYIPMRHRDAHGRRPSFWQWIRDELKIPFEYYNTDVRRRRDLF